MSEQDLIRIFSEWNRNGFEGELPLPEIRWNPRLKTSAGRFIPDRTRSIIEVASYLLEEQNAEHLVRDTIGHEMIHFWLWERKLPYGHTPEFHRKMEELGVSRYNSVPRHRPFKYCYACSTCDQKIFTRKRLRMAACAACCNALNGGVFHARFKLKLLAKGEEVLALERERQVG
jgi:predicted SprT family Zn-dependent metalloprotease